MKNWTIGRQLSVLILALLVLLLGTGIYTIINANASAKGAKTITADRLIPAVDIGTIIDLMQTNVYQLALASMHDPRMEESFLHNHPIDKHTQEIEKNIDQISTIWTGYMDC